MGEKSEIAWTDATFNPWWGCAKVSPACDHCYAERDAGRYLPKVTLWGVDAARRTFGDKHWNGPLRWNKRAIKEGRRMRVFCASMADVFDKNSPPGARERLWETIKATPALDWLLLTKRIGNAAKMLPADWGDGYPNAWLGISVVNQDEVDRDVPKLVATPAAIRFLSCEPLLGPISLEWEDRGDGLITRLAYDVDWVIVGGESGSKSRPMNSEWAEQIADQCMNYRISFFMKQGSQANWPDFKNIEAFPESLRIREWPETTTTDVRASE